jgi:bacillithiol biosynthesis deacetylase BshB1
MNPFKDDILAIAAHPDDVEISAGGTVAKQISLGQKVAIVDLTQGELGSRGSAEIRKKEAQAASEILGVHFRDNLQLKDGFFEYNESTLRLVIDQIRKYQPSIVLTNALRDRHPDHARGAKLVAEACFYSGLNKIVSEYNPWRPKAVYHFNQDFYNEPHFVVDVTDFWDIKMNALKAYSSQFFDPNSKEPQTPISGKEFFDYLHARAMDFGRPANMLLAEGFQVARVPGVNDLMDLL